MARVREQIADSCRRAGVKEDSVTLIAVSKTVGDEAIMEAYNAGQRQFGENRVQEYLRKAEALPDDIEWNLIGHLQTNKAKYIIGPDIFLLQSLDRLELAKTLEKYCALRDVNLRVLIQVNLSREESKSGVFKEDLAEFLGDLTACSHLEIKGLMTIGPHTDDEKAIRAVFAEAKALFDRLACQIPDFEYLSMGMSNDFELAILEGSNMVRVGTSIFGARNYSK
ncbi:MAG: YggS family pyridoxal phosphate-dependent enzyme [Clostridia bacterium]|nr:YggS family pyridoxal phosphate-dependent enzyme [Clostridia bacterium]